MNRRRDKPDGLPFRVYERHGVRARTEVVWLNPACSAALHSARGGLFADHAA